MIIQYGSPGFRHEWLSFLEEDPVHPGISIDKRIAGFRTVLAYVTDDLPQAMICVRFGDKLPQNMNYILGDELNGRSHNPHRYAIFYSIFRLAHSSLKGAGAIAIKAAKEYFREQNIKRFYTLSPIPDLTKAFKNIPTESSIIDYLLSGNGTVSRFHIGNGAEIHAINFNADMSPQRIFESWGIMVNYDYSDYI